jgi:hypothetical protein
MAFKTKKPLSVSLDGLSVIVIPEGEYKDLPEIAIEHGKSIKALEGTGKSVANDSWELPAEKEAE